MPLNVVAILAALGGAQGIVVLAQTFASLAFRFWEMADQVSGKEPIPDWATIIARAGTEQTNIESDIEDIKKWLDEHN